MWKKTNCAYVDGYIKRVTLGIEDVFLFDSRKMLDFWFAYRSQTNHWDGWLITFGCNGFTIQQFNRLRCPKQIKHFRRIKSTVLLECCLLRWHMAHGFWFTWLPMTVPTFSALLSMDLPIISLAIASVQHFIPVSIVVILSIYRETGRIV